MSSDIEICVPEQDDARDILKLVTEINKYHGDPVDQFNASSVQRDVFGEDSPIKTLVAKSGKKVVGFIFYHPSYESGYAERGLFVTDIHVTEKYRRQGIAKALMKAVAKEADKLGYTFLWWASKRWNHGAHAFYRELGAVEEPIVAHALVNEQFKELIED